MEEHVDEFVPSTLNTQIYGSYNLDIVQCGEEVSILYTSPENKRGKDEDPNVNSNEMAQLQEECQNYKIKCQKL